MLLNGRRPTSGDLQRVGCTQTHRVVPVPRACETKVTMPRHFFSSTLGEFAVTLATIEELKQKEQWEEIIQILGVSLKRLLRTNLKEVGSLTETGLLALIVKDGPTLFVPCKKMVLIALLKETGDYALKMGQPKAATAWYIKALHFLLDCIKHGEIIPEYAHLVPTLEVLLEATRDSPLPIETRLLLMREYERRALFVKAWNEFQTALKRAPSSVKLLDFGISFLERLLYESDATLMAESLNRTAVRANLAEMVARKEQLC